MSTLSRRILEALQKSKQIPPDQIQKALLASGGGAQGRLTQALVAAGLVNEEELLTLLSAELQIPFIYLKKCKLNPDLSKIVPEKLARQHQVVPISKLGKALTVATSDPLNVLAIDDLAMATGHTIECVISSPKDIDQALARFYSSEGSATGSMAEGLDELPDSGLQVVKTEEDAALAAAAQEGSEAPVVKMVDLLIQEALKKRASDIHIEPFEKNVRVRYRIDGNLEPALVIPKKSQNGVLTRIRILSRLDITENRIPQDGRFKIKLSDREVDFRVSILPVYFGNKAVLRILDKSALSVGLDNLGFSPETLESFKAAVCKPFGMILMTGPTGSGKSTTLYSILNQLNTPEKNIITIEDPIEYQVKGITQIQTKPEIGLTFASGLRAVLRQSPDVVMVGEIRDFETVDIAIKAALTGQLVLSTLHTNDAAGAMTRLVDMGVEPFLIASSVILVAAQRLCRKICPFCKEKIEIPKDVFERLNIAIETLAPDSRARVFYKGKGCAKCGKTGYLGRMGILETLLVDDEIRDLVIERVSAHEIKNRAVKKGMITLREDALRKWVRGLTTLDEVIRVTSEDQKS
jgi:type IV pilus assembly protein PilB